MNYDFEMSVTILQMLVYADLILLVFANKKLLTNLECFLFFGCLGCYLIKDIYWCLAVLIIKEPVQYFSATDVALMGVLLYLASLLRVERKAWAKFSPFVAQSVLFTIGNAVLWYLWFGRLGPSLFVGTAMCVCSYGLAASMEMELDRKHLIGVYIGTGLVFACEVGLFFVKGYMYIAGNVLCYGLWLILIVLAGIYTIRTKSGRFAPAIACHETALLAQMLSNGIMYIVFVILVTISVVLITVQVFRQRRNAS